ncbi:4-coumarate:coenzyme A ligase 4 [Fagus crenata]
MILLYPRKKPSCPSSLDPVVFEAAVVGRLDDHLGETCAFLKLKGGCSTSAKEIIKLCKDRLPHYMALQTVVFVDLPKTSTGKMQRNLIVQLRIGGCKEA